MGLDKLIVSACLFHRFTDRMGQLRDGDPEPPKQLGFIFLFLNLLIM